MSDDKILDLVQFVKDLYQEDAFVPLHVPALGPDDEAAVLDVVRSTFVSSVGPQVTEFEDKLKGVCDIKHAVAVSSGTAALHIAMIVAGVRSGDLVLTQPATFVATCNAVSYCGAAPIFIDVSRDDLGMCPDSLGKFLEENCRKNQDGLCELRSTGQIIRACIPVHVFGHLCKISEIASICRAYGIKLIEDAAEALGSKSGGYTFGRHSDLSVTSFNGNKIITTGGGGMLFTNDEELATLAKHLTTTAKQPHAYEYVHDMIGFNYRLPNLNAAMGCSQASRLNEYIANKRETAGRYREFLEDTCFTFVDEPPHAESNFWLNAILCDNLKHRNEVLQRTNEKGVMTRPLWKGMHRLPMWNDCLKADLTNVEYLEDRLVNLPSSVRAL